MERLESWGLLREIDGEAGLVSAVISTGDVARDDAIIDPAGWDFGNYDRNPVILWMHDASRLPFARTVERIAGENELIARAQFDLADPFGADIFRKIQGGYINATSVRWLPKRTEMIKQGEGKAAREVLVFREQELLEWSFCTVPTDPKALIMRADTGTPLDIAALIGEPEDAARPFENEHACRLRDPSGFQPNSFRRVRRESEGKRYDVIMGRLKGETSMTEQSYRYPKDVWETAEARRHCRAHDGIAFEPAAAASIAAQKQARGRLERELAGYVAQRMARPTVDDMIVNALATATGKTQERIRRDLVARRGS